MATYYINNLTGNDTTGDGSEASPWLTVSKFNTASATGDTLILVNTGTDYNFEASLTLPNKTLTYEGELNDDGTIGVALNGAGADRSWFVSTAAVPPVHTFKNLIFENFIQGADATHAHGIIGAGGSAFACNLVYENVEFRDITIRCGSSSGGGLWGEFGNGSLSMKLTLRRVLIHRIKKLSSSAQNAYIIRNHSSNASWQTPEFIFENIYVDLPYTGTEQVDYFIDMPPSNLPNITATNVVIDARGDSVAVKDGTPGTDSWTYSCLHNTTSNPTLGTGVITSDPLPVDPDNGNFTPQTDSPILDTGIPL